jgi:hypothetical protein
MGETPDQNTDSAAMLDAFRNQGPDLDAKTAARGAAVADAAVAADELFRSRTENLGS